MTDKTKIYIDLKKCSEEQIKSLPQILEKAGENLAIPKDIEYEIGIGYVNLHYREINDYWTCATSNINSEKQELSYPEFINIFNGKEEEKKCCDNPDIQWNKIEISIGDKQGSYKDLNFNFCDNCGETFNEAFD